MWYNSANRDERAFADPYRFDVDAHAERARRLRRRRRALLPGRQPRAARDHGDVRGAASARCPTSTSSGEPDMLFSAFIHGIKRMRVRVDAAAETMDFREVIETTATCRFYRPDPVPDDVLRRVLDGTRWAPTGGNRQGVRFVAVRDAGQAPAAEGLVPAAVGAVRVARDVATGRADAAAARQRRPLRAPPRRVPVLVVVCAQLARPDGDRPPPRSPVDRRRRRRSTRRCRTCCCRRAPRGSARRSPRCSAPSSRR